MAITERTVAERALDALCRVAETEEVRRNPDLRLYDLGILDSLATVQLMVALSEEFGIDVSPAELDRDDWSTPRRIVEYVEGRV